MESDIKNGKGIIHHKVKIYLNCGYFLILYTAVGHAKMKHVTDVIIIKTVNPQSRKIPPINIPTARFMLLMNKYDPFANSGASFMDELSQY